MHTNFLLFLFLYKSNEQNIHYADHTLLTTFSRSKTLKFSSPASFRIELIYADHAVFPNVVPLVFTKPLCSVILCRQCMKLIDLGNERVSTSFLTDCRLDDPRINGDHSSREWRFICIWNGRYLRRLCPRASKTHAALAQWRWKMIKQCHTCSNQWKK